MGTEGLLTRRPFVGNTQTRLEPLAISIHQRNKDNRHLEEGCSKTPDPIEAILRGCVEDPELLERGEALLFVGGRWCSLPSDRSANG